jgi:hypothetical protein
MGRLNKKLKEQKKKPRFNAVEFKLDGIPDEELKTLKAKFVNNGFGFEIEVSTDNHIIPTNFVSGYRREHKPGFNLKKTNKITNTTKIGVEQNVEKLDWLTVIDTNSVSVKDEQIHLGMVGEIERILLEGNKFVKVQVRYVTRFIIRGQCDKPELENWKNLIEYILKDKGYNPNLLIGIVVDSEQDNIEAYNKRLKPIINDFYLPNNFELFYASADAQNDSILNQAISFCDKLSTEHINEFKKLALGGL